METQNYIGYALYVAEELPATNDETGFDALTWIEVPGMVNGPQFGYTHDKIPIPDLRTGVTTQVKGMGTGMDTTLMVRQIPLNPGQLTLALLALDNDGQCSLKIVRVEGDAPADGDRTIASQGFLHSYQLNAPSPTTYEGFSVTFTSNDAPVVGEYP